MSYGRAKTHTLIDRFKQYLSSRYWNGKDFVNSEISDKLEMNEESKFKYEMRNKEGDECRYDSKYSTDVKLNLCFGGRGRKWKQL